MKISIELLNEIEMEISRTNDNIAVYSSANIRTGCRENCSGSCTYACMNSCAYTNRGVCDELCDGDIDCFDEILE